MSENTKQDFPLFSFLAIMTVLLPSNNGSWMCSCIFSSSENGIPLNKLFTLGETFQPVMLAIQSDIAKYYCICTQGVVAFQTSGVFDAEAESQFVKTKGQYFVSPTSQKRVYTFGRGSG